jgi:hypothetical protein
MHGPWVVGALVNNAWAGSGNDRLNEFTINPFVDFNLARGWYFVSSEIMTADWTKSSNRWTVPFGMGIGRVFKVGPQRLNPRVQYFNNVERPTFAPTSQLQYQVQFLFLRR